MNKYIPIYLLLLLLGSTTCLFAQNNSEPIIEYPAFKAMKIGNLQSTKLVDGKTWYMNVSHRFGAVNDGISTFFGLDNANTNIQMIYGLWDGFQLGISRESLRKTYAGSAKARIIRQTNHFPLTMVWYSAININTELSTDRYPNLKFLDRLSYAHQLLISRRISERISLQLAPSYIRQNLVLEPFQLHNQFAIGIGGKLQLTKLLSLSADYSWNLNRASESIFNDPLTIGLDIETGGHVFQLLFSNAQSTNEPGFLTNAEGYWWDGTIFFGFNIVRSF